LVEAPVRPEDVLFDLGAGLGKVLLVARLLTGATVCGVELQPALVERARAAAARLGVDAEFVCGDARTANLESGTVFYLYAPFTGSVLAEVLARLRLVAARRAIVICALGIDLQRAAPWLVPRASDSFWLTVYDSVISGVSPRAQRHSALGANTDIVTRER
jgi:SAM-dependent methyltransferase